MPSIIPIDIIQGTEFADGFTITNALTGSAPASNLSSAEFLIKNNLSDTDAAAVSSRSSSEAAELTIDDAANWTITIKYSNTETAALTAGRYVGICKTVDAAGNDGEAFNGPVVIHERGAT